MVYQPRLLGLARGQGTLWIKDLLRPRQVLLRAAERDYKTFSILRDNPEAPLAEAGTTVEATRLWANELVESKE